MALFLQRMSASAARPSAIPSFSVLAVQEKGRALDGTPELAIPSRNWVGFLDEARELAIPSRNWVGFLDEAVK